RVPGDVRPATARVPDEPPRPAGTRPARRGPAPGRGGGPARFHRPGPPDTPLQAHRRRPPGRLRPRPDRLRHPVAPGRGARSAISCKTVTHGGSYGRGMDSMTRPAVRDGLGVGIAVGLSGVAFGAAAVASGLGVAQACALSLLAFTGASQFALIGVVAGGGSLIAGAIGAVLLGGANALHRLRHALALRLIPPPPILTPP